MNIVTSNKIIAILVIAIMIITITTPIFAAYDPITMMMITIKTYNNMIKLMQPILKLLGATTAPTPIPDPFPDPEPEPVKPPSIKDSKITKDSIVKVGVNGALPKVTKAELEKMIKDASITSTSNRRANLLAQVDKFIQIQENYKVNALFAVAVAIEETGAGTMGYGKSRKNWFNIRKSSGEYKSYTTVNASIENFGTLISGDTYFGASKVTIINIGKTYCDSTWATKVTSHMNSLVKYL